MKKWKDPSVKTIELSETMFGGENVRNVDITWTDEEGNYFEEYNEENNLS